MKKPLNTLLGWLMIGLVVFAVGSAMAPQAAVAQAKDDAGEEDAPPANAKKKDAPKAEEGEGGEGAPKEKNFLIWVAEVSGLIGVVLLLLSIYFVAVTARMFMELRFEVLIPPDVIEDCDKFIQARDFAGLYKRLKGDNSFFSKVTSAGIAELQNGIAESRDAMERIGEVETIILERKISMLAVLGTLGPMIGLLGTLKGMIGAFSAIAISGTQLKATEVADKISEALVLTFEGVALSVPAIYFFALFRNRISSFTASSMLEADGFVRKLYTAMKKGAPPAAQPAAAPPLRT